MRHKHKKTREQKIIADYRHKEYILENTNTSFNISTPVISINKTFYSYNVLNDVLKTGLLTFCIIALQLILLFVLKKHIFSIPNLNY